jgi:glycosyltransferase involved in cell wall biosynthesis
VNKVEAQAQVWVEAMRCLLVRTALAVISLTVLAAISMATHWAGPINWETDGLFYQSKVEEISGTDAATARHQVFTGPLSNYERQLEVETPSEPHRVSDPAWVEYSSGFYARRLLLPAIAAAMQPVFGVRSLQLLSLLGFVLVPGLLFLLLRRRLPFAISGAVAAATILWPPLRAWSVFPLTDSTGLALLIASLLFGVLAADRGRRWLVPWFLSVLALAFTRDLAFMPVISAVCLLAVRRDRISVALVGSGIAASLPALAVHSVSLSESLAYVFANHTIPADTSWGSVLADYPGNLGHIFGRYLDYASGHPLVVAAALLGIAAAFVLAPRRDALTLLVWGTLPGYLLLMAIGPAFSAFRYELVLVPLMALGYAYLGQRALRWARDRRLGGVGDARALGPHRPGEPRAVLIAVHSAAPGGAQAMALAQAEHYAGRCEIVAAVPEGPLQERFAACATLVPRAPSLPTWGVTPWRWALQLLRSCTDAFRLARLIREHEVDAVLTSSTVLLAPILAARLAGVPGFAHAREWPTARNGRAVFWLQGHCADVVVAISAGVAARFRSGRARVTVIPDGITARPGEAVARELADPPRLCVVGSLTGGDGKGQHRAVEVLGLLREQGVEATLSVVGPILDEDYAERVRDAARRCGVADRVTLTGPVDDVPALLREHDALLFCSSQGADVTPLVVMEALVEERPVIATDVGSVAEVLEDGACGTVVPAADVAAMAAAVRGLVADPERARAQARRGAERVRLHYDREAGIERLWTEIAAEDRAFSRPQKDGQKFPRPSSVSQTATPATPSSAQAPNA